MIIETASIMDLTHIKELDKHIPTDRLINCINNGFVYVLKSNDVTNDSENISNSKTFIVGILRYSLFWQTIPFLDLLFIKNEFRNKGYGTIMMKKWQDDMKKQGFCHVLTSTQADEEAYKFYEKLGYKKSGGFYPPNQSAEELIYVKELI